MKNFKFKRDFIHLGNLEETCKVLGECSIWELSGKRKSRQSMEKRGKTNLVEGIRLRKTRSEEVWYRLFF